MISFSKIMRNILTERRSFKDLLRGSESGRIQRGKNDVNVRPLRVTTLDGNETWTFRYKSDPSTTGNPWHGYVQFFKEDVSHKDNAEDLECMINCDCPDYCYRYAYNNAQDGVGYIGKHPDAPFGNQNNGRKWKPRSRGGVGDYGVGLCIAEGQLVSTDKGLIPIEDVTITDKVWTLDGWQPVLNKAKTGYKQVVDIHLKSGRIIKVTPEHKILTFNEKNGFDWTEAKKINNDHFTCISFPENIELNDKQQKYLNVSEYRGEKIYYPEQKIKLNHTISELVGYMTAEGDKHGLFCNLNEQLINDFFNKWSITFGNGSCTKRKYGCYIGSHGNKILEQLGYKPGCYYKEVPDWIMTGNKNIIISFLRGCYAGDGNFRNRHSTYATVSEKLARNMQLLLNFIGIDVTLKSYNSGVKKSLIWVLRTSSKKQTQKLYELLNPIRGYSSIDKFNHSTQKHYPDNDYLIKCPRIFFSNIISSCILPTKNHNDLIPLSKISSYFEWMNRGYNTILKKLLNSKKLLKKIPWGKRLNDGAMICDIIPFAYKYKIKKMLKLLLIPKQKYAITRYKIISIMEKLKDICPDAYKKIELLTRKDLFFDKVVKITNSNECNVYDLTVKTSEHFTVSGVIVHNCKHLCALSEYLKTKIDPDAPEPGESPEPSPFKLTDKNSSNSNSNSSKLPSSIKPTTINAPTPEDSYSDSRTGSNTLQEQRSMLYERLLRFVNSTPEFEVQYKSESINEFVNIVSEAHERGEWWIDETGGTVFADGDVGDANHEAVVISSLIHEILSHFGIDDDEPGEFVNYEDQIKQNLLDDGRLDNDELAGWDRDIIIKKLIEDKVYEDPKQAEDAVCIAYGSARDARDYAMKYWRWKIMKTYRGNIEVQTWHLKPDDLSIIVRGIWEIMDNDSDDPDDSDNEVGADGYPGPRINVTVQASGKRFIDIPLAVLEKKMPQNLHNYRSGTHTGYTENINENYHFFHKEYRLYEGNHHVVAIFEDNTRLKFEVHFHNNHGEDKDKWRRKAFTTWKSIANELHSDVQLTEVGNPIQKTWKECFQEALKHPKMKEYIRRNSHQKVFDPINFTPME